MNPGTVNWKALERLRRAFLDGTAGARDYWRDEVDLASYDATFAQRIGWKWDYVLAELAQRGWEPPAGEMLDWGCGSGIAHRACLDHWGTQRISALWVADRSPLAARFAAARARAKYPVLAVNTGVPDAPAVLLLSHVLTELEPAAVERLLQLAEQATTVLWVEPGTYEASRALIAVRERLSPKFNLVSPCPHKSACGMLAPGNERHWCHHFATPPPEVFTDGDWARFANLMEIDLRSLPLSFLVLDRRPVAPLPAGTMRVIGRPRVNKADARLFLCSETGVGESTLTKRALPEAFQAIRKGEWDPWQVVEAREGRVTSVRPVHPK
jgi:hypothetical protein